MKKKYSFIYTAFGLVAIAALTLNDASGRKGGYAGAPSDVTCTSCHSDRPHDVNGGVTITGAPANYTAETIYPLTLTIKDAAGVAGGFQIVATSNVANNNVMYGSFTAGVGSKIASTAGASPLRLTHTTPKVFAGGQVSWTFSWTAPATGSDVRFYFAGNASNFDNDETIGDAIYTNTQLTVPVELISFEGNAVDKSVKLTWKTASERNNRVFEIERNIAKNANAFEKIGEVKGLANTSSTNNYDFIDDTPQANNFNYYRLHQVDLDGTSSFSKIISVGLNNTYNNFNIYPNFVSEGALIQFETVNSDACAFDILDISGKIVRSIKKAQNTEGGQVSTIGLPTGRYFIRSAGYVPAQTATFIVF
jgi:hypothetical protein